MQEANRADAGTDLQFRQDGGAGTEQGGCGQYGPRTGETWGGTGDLHDGTLLILVGGRRLPGVERGDALVRLAR